jgi:TPP-dependent pyruvate/acetoin dehydrogenase alpha subunit
MLQKAQLLELYYWLQLNRALEDRLTALYRTGKVVGGLYSSRGQEAISVAAAFALDAGDFLAPMIRNLGALLVRGFSPADILTQYMARRTSPSGGRDCNIHIGDLERGVVPPVSILGALMPVMAGIALAARMQKKSIVALTFIGDGGASTGDFHEGVNFAAVHRLPLVVVIEDNGWAYSTPTGRQAANPDFTSRGPAYGVKAWPVDGNDVLAMYEGTRQAVEHARRGDGPALVIAKTMRMKGHAEHDDAWYVPKEELELWRSRDPIIRFENYLVQSGFVSAEERDMILSRIRSEVDSATEFAEMSPFPDGEAAAGGVYH